MGPGESWGYRARARDPLVEVRVLRLGTSKPPRVLVVFVDDVFEGKEEWVSPARLKVLWSEAEEFQASEVRWNRLASVGPAQDDPRGDAASEILDKYLDEEIATVNYRGGTALCLKDPKLLAEQLGLQVEQLTSFPEAFTEGGCAISPWPAAELVAKALARRNADQILRRVAREEQQARYDSIYGRPYPRSGVPRRISAEICAEVDRESGAPLREVLRSWCGADNVDRFDELIALHQEIQRVGDVAQRMIDAMKANGEDVLASEFQRELDTPGEEPRGASAY